jgi:hypothetical protein
MPAVAADLDPVAGDAGFDGAFDGFRSRHFDFTTSAFALPPEQAPNVAAS